MGYKCIIPAGGFGVRLGDLTKEKPKALLPIGDITVLDHIYEKLCELPNLEEICIISNEKYYGQFADWLQTVARKKPISLISNGTLNKENDRGANKSAWCGIEKMGWYYEDVLIMGSDNFIPISLKEVSDMFVEIEDSIVVVCDYKDKEKVKRLVVPVMDDKGYVTHMEEKPQEPKTTLGCPLIYFIKAKDLKYLHELAEQEKGNIGHVLELIQQRSKLKGYLTKNYVIDIGTFPDYTAVKDLF